MKLLSAFLHKNGMVIAQRAIPEGGNEITEVIPLLELRNVAISLLNFFQVPNLRKAMRHFHAHANLAIDTLGF